MNAQSQQKKIHCMHGEQLTNEKLVSIYYDQPTWSPAVEVDDFLVTIGKKHSNSVYHVVQVKIKPQGNRMNRFYLKCYRSDLLTALQRDKTQTIYPMYWYKR